MIVSVGAVIGGLGWTPTALAFPDRSLSSVSAPNVKVVLTRLNGEELEQKIKKRGYSEVQIFRVNFPELVGHVKLQNIPLTLIKASPKNWGLESIKVHLEKTQTLYINANISFDGSLIVVLDQSRHFDHLIYNLKKSPQELFLKSLPKFPRPLIVFSDTATAHTTGFSYHSDFVQGLLVSLTAWITSGANQPSYLKSVLDKNYSILAHELAHIFLKESYHEGFGKDRSIMSPYFTRKSHLTSNQISIIQKNIFATASQYSL